MRFVSITILSAAFMLLSGCTEASIDSPEEAAQVATTKSEYYQNIYLYLGNEENQTRISSASASYIDEHENVFPASDGQIDWVKGHATPLTYTDIQSINKNPKDYEGALLSYEGTIYDVSEQEDEGGVILTTFYISDENFQYPLRIIYEGSLDVLDGDYLYFWGVLAGNSSYQNVDNGITLISDFVASHVEGY